MRSKNSRALTLGERDHLEWIKQLDCVVCNAGAPTEAHHIEQGLHYATLPLCKDCHTGSHNGIHGRRSMWNVMRKTELSCLNELIGKLRGQL